MSAMEGGASGSNDKIVSVLHAQLKRVHGRLARTEALLRDEREARRDAERRLRERDTGAAAPTRALVEEAVAKASRAAEERDRAVAAATEGREALRENELLKRGMSNLSSSFEQQEERLRLELEEMGLELRRARAYARRCRAVLLKARALCDEVGEPEEFLGADEDASDDGGESPVGHPADDTTVFLSSADEGRVELFDFDGGGDELDPSSPPRGSEPAG